MKNVFLRREDSLYNYTFVVAFIEELEYKRKS
jgi:hypothetical protein